jgi:predicted nucleic acid-binding protein
MLYLDTNIILRYLLEDCEQFIEQSKEYIENNNVYIKNEV